MTSPTNIFRRFSRQTTHAAIVAGLSLFVVLFLPGCRGLSSRSDAPVFAPVSPPLTADSSDNAVSTPVPQANVSAATPLSAIPMTVYKPPIITDFEAYNHSIDPAIGGAAAFRPIMPEHTIRPEPTVAQTGVDTMVTAPVPTEADRQVDLQQQKIDELNRQVAQLQGDLASALAKSEETNRQTPEALPVPAVATEIVKPSAIPATKPPRKAPMLNIPGVTVTTDAERDEIRFGIVDSVLFVPGTHRISPEAEQVLRRIVAEIRTIGPDQSLEIEGHTDSLNVDPANPTQKHDISTIKSVAVMEYFVKSLLWKPEKIRTSAHGATQPLSDNGTPEGRRQNNRVEIVVLP